MSLWTKITYEGNAKNRERLVELALAEDFQKSKKMTASTCEFMASLVVYRKIKPWKMLDLTKGYYRATKISFLKPLQAELINAVGEEDREEMAFQIVAKAVENHKEAKTIERLSSIIDASPVRGDVFISTLRSALRWADLERRPDISSMICDFNMFPAMRAASMHEDFRPLLEILKNPNLSDGIRSAGVRDWLEMLLGVNKTPEQMPGAEQCLDILINSGADIEYKNRYGQTPLQQAARFSEPLFILDKLNRKMAMEMLLDRGANWRILKFEGKGEGTRIAKETLEKSSAYLAGRLTDVALANQPEFQDNKSNTNKPKM